MESLERLNKLISYVEENLDGEIDNQTLSRIAVCPLAVLQRLFVLMTGATLTEYVRLRRLARAAYDVRGGQEKVIDIAIKYGYDSSDTFCVAFKRRYGMTPTAARDTNAILPDYDRISFTPFIKRVKGDVTMNQSNKVLKTKWHQPHAGSDHHFHPLMDKYQGQNYAFNACMALLMKYLGESKDYDYWFFSGVSGDCFTQVYGQDLTKWYQCLSHACFDEHLIKRVFDACGYDYTFVTPESFSANREKYLQKVVSHIDRDLPVIVKGLGFPFEGRLYPVEEISCIVGYENGGQVLLYLPDTSTTPTPFPLDIPYTLVFSEEKKKAPTLPEVYRQAIANIPSLNLASPRNGVSFGAHAFLDWAEALENGKFDDIPVEDLDCWPHYGAYLCIIASNVSCPHFLNRAKELCPDIKELPAINAVMEKMCAHMDEFCRLEGGFGMEEYKLKDRELMQPVCEMIRKYAGFYNELLAAFR
ncbi:helix-turn-helix domain-containing protein [Gorillibacterium timonense]|uniref:helix-turn-helix domain-containing protein n=1 Tax=Gorillibacterium timonense TaxID=1689269 RepID=UPI00071DC6C3|nr:helix-turn-helix domain-containing protein [Gorillibacterium timonense]